MLRFIREDPNRKANHRVSLLPQMAKVHSLKQTIARLRLPWLRVLAVAAVVLVIFNSRVFRASEEVQQEDFYHQMEHMELESTNAFVHSSYYFESSKSLGDNAIAIVATMSKSAVTDLNKFQIKIVGTNSTHRFVTTGIMSTEDDPDGDCEYTPVLITTNSLDNMSKLEFETRDGLFVLEIMEPKKSSPKPVVFCIAPLFAAEQWQSLLMQLHVSKHYGAHLHVYMTTLVEYYYHMAKELEQQELLTLQAWYVLKFSQMEKPFPDPNARTELRNPAAAYTDCLLQYKEVAQFVGFMEIEDLLFPVNANTYYEEFEREYEGSLLISALYYQVIEQQSEKVNDPSQQSLRHFIGNANSLGTAKYGRAVVRPERYNSTWTHYSTQADKQPIFLTETQEEPLFLKKKEVTTNAVLSFTKMTTVFNSTKTGAIPANPVNTDHKLISEAQLTAIEEVIQQTLSLPGLQRAARYVQPEDYFSVQLKECLSKEKSRNGRCISTKNCELPKNEKLICRHSDGLYHSGQVMRPFTFHFATEPYFTRNLGCYV